MQMETLKTAGSRNNGKGLVPQGALPRRCIRTFGFLSHFLLTLSLLCGIREGEARDSQLTTALVLATALLPLPVTSKKVFGLARGGKFQPIGDFCYSIPAGSTGSLLAETMITEDGHELVVHSKSAAAEYKSALKEAAVLPDATDEGAATATCNALQTNARVRESLSAESVDGNKKPGSPAFFELNLALDASLDMSDVTAWILRCKDGQRMDAAYSVTFLNPGGFFARQFSCQDQGLLQLYLMVSLFGAAVCFNAMWLYRQQQRQSPLSAAATCCCCLLGGGVILYTFHLLAYAADGLGLPLLKFLGQVLLLGSRCVGLLLFLVISAKGVDERSVDPKTNGVISIVALGISVSALAALLGASLAPDELNPCSLYTTLWALPLHTITGVAAVLMLVMALLNADSATRPPQRRLFIRLCFWGTGYVLSPLFIACFLNGYPLLQAYVLLTAEIGCLCALQRMVCREAQQKSTQLGDVKSRFPPADLPYSDL